MGFFVGTVKRMPNDDENLREKLKSQGTSALSNAELLALILRTSLSGESALETANRLLASGVRSLMSMNYAALINAHQLPPAKAAQLVAVIELGRRFADGDAATRPIVESAKDVARLLAAEMENLKQEHMRVVLLDARRRVIGVETVYIGSLNQTIVRAAEVFREAVLNNCASLILVHNHPSGDPTPSEADLTLTEDLIAAGHLLDIAVLDHVIIGHGSWVSLREVGLAF